LLPLALGMALYMPLIQHFQKVAFAPIFQGGPRKIAVYFAKAALGIWLPFLVATLIAWLVAPFQRLDLKRLRDVKFEYYGLAFGLLAVPFLINLIMMVQHTAFFERYAIVTAFAFTALAVLFLGQRMDFSRAAALAVFVVFLLAGLYMNVWKEGEKLERFKHSLDVNSVANKFPGLPFVAASGLSFIEMDHDESPEFVSHLYYLTDREFAIKYANATLFEGLGDLKKDLPIRGIVIPYRDFAARYQHFLVMGDPNYQEDWLLRKLLDDQSQGKGTVEGVSISSLKYHEGVVYEISLKPPPFKNIKETKPK
jgi:hypothetical protein